MKTSEVKCNNKNQCLIVVMSFLLAGVLTFLKILSLKSDDYLINNKKSVFFPSRDKSK